MTFLFEELDSRSTPLGEISLRKRADPRLRGKIIYEVKLGEEFLMSSLFPEAEIQLSHLVLRALEGKGELDVVVGGLGLGYTALAALEYSNVKSLQVVEVMEAVIDWHKQALVPLGEEIVNDNRCTLLQADFFALCSKESESLYPEAGNKKAHAVLLDIDHSPGHWLNQSNSRFYTREGLASLADKIQPGGLFGLWSNDLPDEKFIELLASVFASVEAHVVNFPNPYTQAESSNSVYIASTRLPAK